MTGVERVAFSVDLEPNKDGTLDGVRRAMEWFDRTVPRGTVFTTYRIATELPDLVGDLAGSHEVGVHVHPREFGHDHDQLARLPPERQEQLIENTRTAVADAVDVDEAVIRSFRAGRHSASEETIDVLRQLDFGVDASVHVRYDEFLPASVTRRRNPFWWDGVVEVPTTYATPPLSIRCAVRSLTAGEIPATASTLRTDALFCTGERVIRQLLSQVAVVSMYMHPYDATDYHEPLENAGPTFRSRVRRLVSDIEERSATFVSVAELADLPAGPEARRR